MAESSNKYFRGNLGIALPPLIMISVLFCLVPSLSSATSFMILPCGALAIVIAWRQFRKTLTTQEAAQDPKQE